MFFSVRSWTLRARLRALPESTVSLKTSYFSRESTFRVASDFFEAGGVRYALINESESAALSCKGCHARWEDCVHE